MNIRPMLKLTEVSEIMGLNVQTVRRWAESGKLPAVKVGRHYLVDPDKLEKLLKLNEDDK